MSNLINQLLELAWYEFMANEKPDIEETIKWLADNTCCLDKWAREKYDWTNFHKQDQLDLFSALAVHLGYAINKCEHNWEVVWLTDDLEGFRCSKCGFETIDINYK
jgi:hypothetical protein